LTLLPILASAALAAAPAAAQSEPPLLAAPCAEGPDDTDGCDEVEVDRQVTDGEGRPVAPAIGVSSGFGHYFWSGG
jgi:hypothetical protein